MAQASLLMVDLSAGPTDGNSRGGDKRTGAVQPQFSEPYTFYVTSDDGARLFVWANGQKTTVVDSWINQAATEHSGTVSLAVPGVTLRWRI